MLYLLTNPQPLAQYAQTIKGGRHSVRAQPCHRREKKLYVKDGDNWKEVSSRTNTFTAWRAASMPTMSTRAMSTE